MVTCHHVATRRVRSWCPCLERPGVRECGRRGDRRRHVRAGSNAAYGDGIAFCISNYRCVIFLQELSWWHVCVAAREISANNFSQPDDISKLVATIGKQSPLAFDQRLVIVAWRLQKYLLILSSDLSWQARLLRGGIRFDPARHFIALAIGLIICAHHSQSIGSILTVRKAGRRIGRHFS